MVDAERPPAGGAAGAAPTRVTEAWPPVVGRPGIVQGRYGDHGNLELVACAADDGLWVGWWNADRRETHRGAATGRWSGALHFAAGHRYTSAAVSQVAAGPDFLEVVARATDGELRRHVWAPDTGFVDRGTLATGVRCHSGIHEIDDGSLLLAVAWPDRVEVLQAGRSPDYPAVEFETDTRHDSARPLSGVDAVRHDDHLDLLLVGGDGRCELSCGPTRVDIASDVAAGRLVAAGPDRLAVLVTTDGQSVGLRVDEPGRTWPLGPADDAALCARVSPDGPRWDVLTRRGQRLHHRQLDGRLATVADDVVEADVWVVDAGSPVHRRALAPATDPGPD